ncbi:MAG: MBL fold metallo-hydrolase [Gammaproteobacteria bacterium]|nr:MBL fold metallo-hydrolase [Gammaproteobacteria bacterium]
MKRRIANLCFVAMLLFCGTSLAQADAKRSITKIAGDLYRFQNNFHYSVFLVTSDGIIVTDPINADAARWLKAELAKRFNKPIKYLIYSHDHVDHVAGGEVFANTAIVVAHENAKTDIIAEQRPTAVPDITFSDQMTIELGGKRVELSYVGRSHSDNMIVMRFPAERALFVVDFIPVETVAWKNMTDAYIPDWIDAIARVEAMDFDILVPGHGAPGTKADATAFRGYMETLYAAVLKGAREGKSLEAMQQSVRLEKYKDWYNYDTQLPLNIEGMYNQIKLHRRGN